jgi:hypothetical protein
MSSKFSKVGCALFVHHFEIVAGSLPSCSASHLLVRFFSASTTFNLFRSLDSIFYLIIFIGYKDSKFSTKDITFCKKIAKSNKKFAFAPIFTLIILIYHRSISDYSASCQATSSLKENNDFVGKKNVSYNKKIGPKRFANKKKYRRKPLWRISK